MTNVPVFRLWLGALLCCLYLTLGLVPTAQATGSGDAEQTPVSEPVGESSQSDDRRQPPPRSERPRGYPPERGHERKDESGYAGERHADVIQPAPSKPTPAVVGAAVVKPYGAFSSHVGTGRSLDHPQAKGGLIRVRWSEMERQPGQYRFDKIDEQLNKIRQRGKDWSLAVLAGMHAPDYLKDGSVPMIEFYSPMRGGRDVKIPVFWHQRVQERMGALAQALAARYKGDATLKLVYVPQMTSNGVEGHFNGIRSPYGPLYNAGFTDELWVAAVVGAAERFAQAFDNKALAVEVHEVVGSAEIPRKILYQLWQDPKLEQRVGAAMWWISGKHKYQSRLVDVLQAFPGDIYGQVIGRSNQQRRFQNSDYAEVFRQAKKLNMRYIEPWNFEFENNTHDAAIADYNRWAQSQFGG